MGYTHYCEKVCVSMWYLSGLQIQHLICRVLQRRSVKWTVVASSHAAVHHLQSDWWLSPVSSQLRLKAAVADMLLKVIVLINCPLSPSLMECSLKIKCPAVPPSTASWFLCWRCYVKGVKLGWSCSLVFSKAMQVLMYHMKDWVLFSWGEICWWVWGKKVCLWVQRFVRLYCQ